MYGKINNKFNCNIYYILNMREYFKKSFFRKRKEYTRSYSKLLIKRDRGEQIYRHKRQLSRDEIWLIDLDKSVSFLRQLYFQI